jgi:5-formyltetrahydrofolate cyclo-ligase
MSEAERDCASARIARRFLSSRLFFASDVIGCYLPTYDEVDTSAVLDRAWRAGKRIAVPVLGLHGAMEFVVIFRDTSLRRNRFGIWEPKDGESLGPRDLDVCIVPSVAFDESGNRIGMGSGYYDRSFAFLNRPRLWARPKLVGFAFECQRVEHVNTRSWDVGLHHVITELR